MSDHPRVAHVVISLEHGGLEQCALQWCIARNQLYPHSTMIICLDDAGPLAETLTSGEIISLGANRHQFPWDRKAVASLRESITRNRIDVLHSHNTAARQYACLASRRGLSKHVYTDHSTNIYLAGILNRMRLAYMRRHTDSYTAVSKEAAEALALAEHIPTESIHVIRNGISIPAADLDGGEMAAKQRGVSGDAFAIGYVGRLSHEKGVDRLIRAFSTLVRAEHTSSSPSAFPLPDTDLQLVLVGDGPARAELETLTEDLGIGEHVTFTGAQLNARAVMSQFSLFVLPSRSEGLPLALLEAAAEGVPAMATDVGECTTVLDHGNLGSILPDSDGEWPGALAQEIAGVQSGAFQARTADAYRHVEANYSVKHTLSRYEDIYRS